MLALAKQARTTPEQILAGIAKIYLDTKNPASELALTDQVLVAVKKALERSFRELTVAKGPKGKRHYYGGHKIKDLTTGEIYYSAADAAQKLGLHSSLVYAVLNGHRGHTKGHIFRRL